MKIETFKGKPLKLDFHEVKDPSGGLAEYLAVIDGFRIHLTCHDGKCVLQVIAQPGTDFQENAVFSTVLDEDVESAKLMAPTYIMDWIDRHRNKWDRLKVHMVAEMSGSRPPSPNANIRL